MRLKKYILDTSIVVKWFNQENESQVEQALQLLAALQKGSVTLKTSDLLVHELANALLVGKRVPVRMVIRALTTFFQLPIKIIPTNLSLMKSAISLAEKYNLTTYDAIFVALAKQERCQLSTANPRHHGKVKKIIFNLKDYQSRK